MQPRTLDFQDFDEVAREANRLLAEPHQKAGSWDLAQICNHLADAMTLSMSKGLRPMVPLPVRWYLKWRYLGKVLQRRRLPSGVKAPEAVRFPPSGDPAAAVKRLHEAIAMMKSYEGKFHPHPYFGNLTREQARQFHLIHCAHHLRLLVPEESKVPS